jgi:hypothetical protein
VCLYQEIFQGGLIAGSWLEDGCDFVCDWGVVRCVVVFVVCCCWGVACCRARAGGGKEDIVHSRKRDCKPPIPTQTE